MIGVLIAPAILPEALPWLAAVLAAAGGIVLHAMHPPQDPAVAEALLNAVVHP